MKKIKLICIFIFFLLKLSFPPFFGICNWEHHGSDIFCPDLLYWGSGFDCSGSSPQDFSSHHGQRVSTCRHCLALENVLFANQKIQ